MDTHTQKGEFKILDENMVAFEISYLSYKIAIWLKNSHQIAFYRVATFVLQPAADVGRAGLQHRG